MRQLTFSAAILLAMCFLTACDKNSDVIWDISPIEFTIFMTDSEGHDLLDSTYQGNLIKDIYVTYQGEDYSLMTEQEYLENMYEKADTRAYMPHFYGLMLRQYWNPITSSHDCYKMVFGEFDGTDNIDRREIILHLPENHHVRLAYSNNFKWKSNGEPKIKRHFYLDDKELEGDYFYLRYSKTGGCEYITNGTK